ncbi:MAG: polysaccharide deacetylase family protein [Pirellulales bacterium]|nr:polysaccharide deacetylase family protein [Pirellulales bacterium]
MNTWILIYHALDCAAEPVALDNAADLSVVVGADDFQRQLQYLRDLEMPVVSLEDVLDPSCDLPNRDHVVLTFDDGHRSNWSLGLPRLVEAGVTATFYVVAGWVDKDPEYLTSPQLREMADRNMLIGSHTMTHRFLPQLSREQLHRELADSRARLEDILGRPVVDLAIPGGHTNRAVLEESRQCGYRSVATCKVGLYRRSGDPFRLPRVEIRRELSQQGFCQTFNTTKLRQLQAIELAKACLRKTCGLSAYTRLRRLAHRYLVLNR